MAKTTWTGFKRLLQAAGVVTVAATVWGCQTSMAGSEALKEPEVTPLASSPFGNYLAGRHAQMVQDTRAASIYYTALFTQEPDNVSAQKLAMLTSAMEGRIDEARRFADGMLESDGLEPVAVFLAVSTAVAEGDYAKALKYLERLPKTGVNVFMGPLVEAWALAGDGKTAKALDALAPLEKLSDMAGLYNLHAGLINEAAGKTQLAEDYYKKAINDPNGMSLRVVELLGGVYQRTGRGADALGLYDSYRRENPGSVLIESLMVGEMSGKAAQKATITPRSGVAEAMFGIASALRQQNASETALIFGRLALYLEPNYPIAQILVGDILETMDRLIEANGIYEQIDPKSPFAWTGQLRRATNWDALDQVDRAAEVLERMAAEQPAQIDALVQLGNILRSHAQFEKAADAYDRAIARIGKIEAHHWSLLYTRGIALERSKQWDRAEKDFLKALELEPDQPFVLNYLGYSWVEQGKNLDRAQKMIEKAVELRPMDGYIIDSLGWVQYRLGKFADAVKNLERAVELRPEDPTINDHLGDAYWKVDRKLEAKFQWRRALSLDPDEELAEKIQIKLDRGMLIEAAAE